MASHDNWLHVNLAEYPSQFACQTAEVKKVQPYDGCYYCMTHLLMNTKSIIGAIFHHEKKRRSFQGMLQYRRHYWGNTKMPTMMSFWRYSSHCLGYQAKECSISH